MHRDWADRAAYYVVKELAWSSYGPWVKQLEDSLAHLLRATAHEAPVREKSWRLAQASALVAPVAPRLSPDESAHLLGVVEGALAVASAQRPHLDGDSDVVFSPE